MSQENVELIRRAYEHLRATREPLAEVLHPDVVWEMSTYRGAILPGTYFGVEGVREFLGTWTEPFEDWSVQIDEIFDAGDRVLTIGTQRGKPHDGPEVEMHFGQLWSFRDGLVSRMEMYATREEALEAAGLRE
jgi:ketosteroid isomerase-like protein